MEQYEILSPADDLPIDDPFQMGKYFMTTLHLKRFDALTFNAERAAAPRDVVGGFDFNID